MHWNYEQDNFRHRQQINIMAVRLVEKYISTLSAYPQNGVSIADICVIAAYFVSRTSIYTFEYTLLRMYDIFKFDWNTECCLDVAVRNTGIDIDAIYNNIMNDAQYRDYITSNTYKFMNDLLVLWERERGR